MNIRESHLRQRAVSLIELSIVLVIIALIVGVLFGIESLQKGAESRNVISQVQEYITAIDKFQLKYQALPGDMGNATSVITGAVGNGDSDGQIVWSDGEGAQAWQHLGAAMLIKETTLTGLGASAITGTNVPESYLEGVGYYIDFDNTLKNHIGIGADDGSAVNDGPGLMPRVALGVDTQMDDGVANTGKVTGSNNTTVTNCHNSGVYNVLYETDGCFMEFQLPQR